MIEIFDNPVVDAIIDGLIVFFLSIITELLAFPGLPTFECIYHGVLVASLASLVFYAKKRGINHIKENPY